MAIEITKNLTQVTISTAGVAGGSGTSGTSGTFGNVLSSSLYISGSIIPNTTPGNLTSSFSLGSSTNAWKDLWISQGTIYFIGDNQQTASISINENNQFVMQDVSFNGDVTTTSLKISSSYDSNFLIINSGSLAFKDLNGSSSLTIYGGYTSVPSGDGYGGFGGSFSSIVAGQNEELRLYAYNGAAGIIISSDGINIGTVTAGSVTAILPTGLVSGSSQVISILSSLNSFSESLNSKTGSYATTGSNTFYDSQTISGSLNVTGSVNIDNVIKFIPVTTFPSGQAGMLVASASYGKTNLYVYDGSNWKWLVTGSIA